MSSSRQDDAFNCVERKNSSSVILGLLGCTKVVGGCASFVAAAGCCCSVLFIECAKPIFEGGCEMLSSAKNDFAAICNKENDGPKDQRMQDSDESNGYRSLPGGVVRR